MPRIRTIKPDFWNDEKLGQEPEAIMLTIIGMLNFSDDYGVVRANPMFLKNQLFPYKATLRLEAFSTWLDRLAELEVIILFTYRGESFYYIRTFRKHQKVEKPSKARNVPEGQLLQILYELGYVMQDDFAFTKTLSCQSGSTLPEYSGSSRETVGEQSGWEKDKEGIRIRKGEGESPSGKKNGDNSENLNTEFPLPIPPGPAPPPFPVFSGAAFTPPSPEDVKHHFRLRGGRDDMAEAFFGKWSGVDWMDGRSYLKNWPARIPTFITNFLKNEQQSPGKNSKPSGNIVSGNKNYGDA